MNKNLKKLLTIALLLIPSLGFNAIFKPNNLLEENNPLLMPSNINKEFQIYPTKTSAKNQVKQSSLEVDEKTLLENPNLLKRAMASVILAKNIDQITIVLPIYNQLLDKKELLIHYANALLFHNEKKYQQAISLYRRTISKNPNFIMARFDLALALYEDKQFSSAHYQLIKLRNEKLSNRDHEFIERLIGYIEKNDNWSFTSNFYYRHENNINKVPKQKQIGVLEVTTKPDNARGFHLSLGAYRKFNLEANWFSILSLSTSINHFFNISDYNDYYFQIGTGLGYQTADYSIQLKPFVGRRIYGNNAYSKSFGLGLNSYYKLSNQWQITNYTQWYDESYDKYKYLNGERYSTDFSLGYARSSTQFLTIGIDYYKNSTKPKHSDNEFRRRGFSAGWQQEWPYEISTNFNLYLSEKDYYGVDNFYIQRSDKKYVSSLSFEYRDFHFLGVTPKFYWQWERTRSNHSYHDHVNNQFFIKLSKKF